MSEQLSIFDAPLDTPEQRRDFSKRLGEVATAAWSKAGADPPRARNTDPTTSHAAARKASHIQLSHHNLIMAALATPGNIYELGARTGLGHVAVARRLPELLALKLARPTDEKREGCRIWEHA